MCLVSLRSICIFQQLFCVLFAHLVGNYKNRTTFNHNLAAKSGELPCPGISVPQIHFDSHLIFANFWLLLPSPAFRSLAKWLSNCCGSKLGTGSPGHDHQWLISQPGTDDGPKKKKKGRRQLRGPGSKWAKELHGMKSGKLSGGATLKWRKAENGRGKRKSAFIA